MSLPAEQDGSIRKHFGPQEGPGYQGGPHDQRAKEAEDTEEQKPPPEDQTVALVTTGQIPLPSQKNTNASKYLSPLLPTKVGRERGGEDMEMMV